MRQIDFSAGNLPVARQSLFARQSQSCKHLADWGEGWVQKHNIDFVDGRDVPWQALQDLLTVLDLSGAIGTEGEVKQLYDLSLKVG